MRRVLFWALVSLPCVVMGADVSTHSFAGCNFPDTGQKGDYTGVFGEDNDYAYSGSALSFTVYNGVDWGGTATSSVTVDNRTGLMWITNPVDAGLSGTYTWLNALAACEGVVYAGHSDWRLPNISELMSIVDYNMSTSPQVNAAYFPNTQLYYWTSTTYVPTTTRAWIGILNNGTNGSNLKTNRYYIRCVRAGP